MSDTLEIFGQEWTGVTGFKATDDNDLIKTFIRPQGTLNISQSGNTDVTNYATANVPAGTAGTPTATKGTVSNHQVTVTPYVANTTGYITGGTETGTPVTVTAAELASGSKTITQNGTDIDVVGYSTVDVAVPSSSPTIQSLTVTPSTSQQTFNASGVDGYKPVTVNAMPTMTLPTSAVPATQASGQRIGTIFPQLVGDRAINIPVGYNDTAKYYNISPADLMPLTITENGVYDPADPYDVYGFGTITVNVSGGSTKNIQVNSGSASVRTNGYTSTGLSLTVAKTGTYKVSWTAWRSSSSGTMGTNLHRNNSSGTNQQTWTNTYGQHIVLNNQSYNAGDVLTLYATAGSTSRYCWVSNLIIEEQ